MKFFDKNILNVPLGLWIFSVVFPSVLLMVFWFLGMSKEEVMGIWLGVVGLPLLFLIDSILDP